MLIDSHCHLDFPVFDTDRDAVLAECRTRSIQHIIVPAVMATDWQRQLKICKAHSQLHPALGMHPMFMTAHKPEHIAALDTAVIQHSPIAIGEIGLDHYLPEHDKIAQLKLFTAQLQIAQKYQLPVLLHIRKAHDVAIAALRQTPVVGGIVHAFNASAQQAAHYQKLNFLFGIGGAINHPRATRLRQLVTQLPLSSLVLETDAPDMPLANNTGRNSPIYLSDIATCLAKLRNVPVAEIIHATTTNFSQLFPDVITA